MDIIYDKGIHFEEIDLWMDSSRIKDYCYVSHAHSDHTARHRKILGTPETIALACHRLGKLDAEAARYGEWIERDDYRFKLFPAGHILGSSQILIDTGKLRIVYTGDFRFGGSRTCAPAMAEKCDILLMETTYGISRYDFPDRSEVEGQFIQFIRETLEIGGKPVVMAYSLGKAQEAMAILSTAGMPVTVDESIYKIARIYERFGLVLGSYSRYRGQNFRGVLIIPPHMRKYKSIRSIKDKTVIMLTGWGMDNNLDGRYGADRTFIISDHCDYNSLMEYVRKVKPSRILTMHGFEQFAGDLRNRGYDALCMKTGRLYDLNVKHRIPVNLDLFE